MVEQPVSEHLKVRRADASQMFFHRSKSSNKSCRAKSCASKGACIIKKLKNEQVMHILMSEGQKHSKKIP
jgi:hypothetical protein